MENFFVIPNDDLEALAIISLLKRNGYEEGKNLFITNQAQEASWEKLEPEIIASLQKINSKIELEKGNANLAYIYGIELQGVPQHINAMNIDHHKYKDDDRSNNLSSIEQVSYIIDAPLTLRELFIAANDKGHIQAMKELAEKCRLTK